MLFIIIMSLVVVAILTWFLQKAFAIISAYGAKIVCSGVFISGRSLEDIVENDLGSLPFSLGKYTVDQQQQMVTGTVSGMARKRAVYRKGLGAVVLNKTTAGALMRRPVSEMATTLPDQDQHDWPNGNRTPNQNQAAIDDKKLQAALDEAFAEGGKPLRGTRAVVVLYNGEIVAERYAKNFSPASKLAGWSMAKSVTNALLGILVKQGKADVTAPAPIDEWQHDSRKNITLTHLLQMSSGLRWWEYYAAPSDVTNMLYNENSMSRFAMQKSAKYEPGTRFNYSSGTTNILSSIIRKIIGDEYYYQFPYEQLFYKIGMLNTVVETDASGTFVGSSYCLATARDWARFGLLYMNDGVWNGERILPEGWVKFTTTATTATCRPDEGRYGAQWWVNASKTGEPAGRKYPGVPEDCFYCQGYEGQYVWVIPSKKLVVVRLALEKGDELNPNVFLPAVIRLLPS